MTDAWFHMHPGDRRTAHPVGRSCDWVGQDVAPDSELPEGLVLGDGVRRAKSCVETWPGADSGEYNPACCRFPKSCSATSVRNRVYTETKLEDAEPAVEAARHPVGFSAGGKPVYVLPESAARLDPAKQRAMEQIITASFRAGCEIGRLYREPVEPIIEWDGLKPSITGYKVST